LFAWLSLEALRIWIHHGPTRSLLGSASYTAFAALALRGDYAAAYRAMRRILELGAASGYEPDTSYARLLFAAGVCHWFEPIENGIGESRRARAGLIAGGEVARAGFSYLQIARSLLDCAPTLDAYVAELEDGLAFAHRTGSTHVTQVLEGHLWLPHVLSREIEGCG
jgi:hypothetical protein